MLCFTISASNPKVLTWRLSQVLGRSREYYWQMLDRQIRAPPPWRPGDGMNIWICCFWGHDTPVEKNTLPKVGDSNQGPLLVQFHMSMCTIQDFKLSKCKPVRFHQGSMCALPLLPDCRFERCPAIMHAAERFMEKRENQDYSGGPNKQVDCRSSHSTAVGANQLNDLTVNTRESKSDAPVCNLSISFTKQCPNPWTVITGNLSHLSWW